MSAIPISPSVSSAFTLPTSHTHTYTQIPAALMNVIEEKSLKDVRNVNLFFLLFWTSLYQLLTVGVLFWVDILPGFGFADGIQQFGQR